MRSRLKSIIITFSMISCLQTTAQTYIQYVDSADYYIRRELWNQAEDMTIKALKTMPANKLNYLLWSNLGDIRSRKGDNDGALQAFDIALASSENNATILAKRAYVYLSKNDIENALIDINRSLQIDSVQEWPLQARASIRLNNGKYEEATSDFKSLHRHFPNNYEAYTGLGKIASARGDVKEAENCFRRSIALKDSEEARFLLILLLINNDKVSEAKEELLVSLKRYPRAGNLYLLRGVIHKINFENESAMIDRKIALDYGASPELVKQMLPIIKK